MNRDDRVEGVPPEGAGEPAAKAPERGPEEAKNPFRRYGLFEWAMPAAAIFIGVFYVLPGAYFLWPLLPRLAPLVPGPVAGGTVLGAVFLAIWLLMWLLSPPRLPSELGQIRDKSLWFRMQRRTGVARLDIVGFLVAAGLAVGLAFFAPIFTPGLGALAIGFLGMGVSASNLKWDLIDFRRELPEIPEPVPEEGRGDLVPVTLSWDYERPMPGAGGFHNEVTVGISQITLEGLRSKNPFREGQVPRDLEGLEKAIRMLVHEGTTFEVREVARYLLGQARRHGLSLYEEIDNALRMVQSAITYQTDQESLGHEYWRFPLETLHDRVGDSDCKAILAAALFRVLFTLDLRSLDPAGSERDDTRRDVVVLLSETERHVAVAVEGPPGLPGDFLRLGERCYYFCEATNEGMRVGQRPTTVAWQNYRIIRLEPEETAHWRRRSEG